MSSGYAGYGGYGGYGRYGGFYDDWCDYCGERWDCCECDMAVGSGGREPSTARDNVAYTPPETMNYCPLQWCSAFWHGERCDDYRCDGIHLCRFFVEGRCMFESYKCWSGHSLRTQHNSRVLRRCGMDRMSDVEILDILGSGGPRDGDRVYYGDDLPPRRHRRKHHQRRRQQEPQQRDYAQSAHNYQQQQQTRPQHQWPLSEARQLQQQRRRSAPLQQQQTSEPQQQQHWPMQQQQWPMQQQQRRRSEPLQQQQLPIQQQQQQRQISEQQQDQPTTMRWTGVLQFQVGPQQPPRVELLSPFGPERGDQLQQPAAAPRAAETPCKPSATRARCSSPASPECRRSPPPEVSEELQCAVCLGTLERATTLGCGHSFCAACVEDVRRVEPKCPICRVNIKTWTRSITLDNVINSLARKW